MGSRKQLITGTKHTLTQTNEVYRRETQRAAQRACKQADCSNCSAGGARRGLVWWLSAVWLGSRSGGQSVAPVFGRARRRSGRGLEHGKARSGYGRSFDTHFLKLPHTLRTLRRSAKPDPFVCGSSIGRTADFDLYLFMFKLVVPPFRRTYLGRETVYFTVIK